MDAQLVVLTQGINIHLIFINVFCASGYWPQPNSIGLKLMVKKNHGQVFFFFSFKFTRDKKFKLKSSSDFEKKKVITKFKH